MDRISPEQLDGASSVAPDITDEFSRAFTNVTASLRRQIRRGIRNGHDVEDLLQETALHGWQRCGRLKKKESFASWILKIAANTVKDFYRKRDIDAEHLDRYQQQIRGTRKEQKCQIHPDSDPPTLCLVNEIIRLLPKDCRETYRLTVMEEFTVRELARRFQVHENTIRYRLQKAETFLENVFGRGVRQE